MFQSKNEKKKKSKKFQQKIVIFTAVKNHFILHYKCAIVMYFSAVSCSRLSLQCDNKDERLEDPKIISTSAPASTNCLLGNFEVIILVRYHVPDSVYSVTTRMRGLKIPKSSVPVLRHQPIAYWETLR